MHVCEVLLSGFAQGKEQFNHVEEVLTLPENIGNPPDFLLKALPRIWVLGCLEINAKLPEDEGSSL